MPTILFCIWGAPDPTYGGGRVYHELIEGLKARGWKADAAVLPILRDNGKNLISHAEKCALLRQHILSVQDQYDIVEYDLGDLPYPRSDFRSDLMMAARSVLLELHSESIRCPKRLRWRTIFKQWVLGRSAGKLLRMKSQALVETARQADIIHVSSQEDVTVLLGRGVTVEKIISLPYGLSTSEICELQSVCRSAATGPCVLFLGTFDWRKGAADMPEILRQISHAHPTTRFRLAGTKGLFPDEASVRTQFPRKLQSQLEIIPRYERSELKGILQDCDVGIFPSYLEGCPFSVLEQMAAGIPLIAYRAPGASLLLPDECLVTAGDTAALTTKVSRLLSDNDAQQCLAAQLIQRASEFTWDKVLDALDKIYREKLSFRL